MRENKRRKKKIAEMSHEERFSVEVLFADDCGKQTEDELEHKKKALHNSATRVRLVRPFLSNLSGANGIERIENFSPHSCPRNGNLWSRKLLSLPLDRITC
jgi:hypothetical protein